MRKSRHTRVEDHKLTWAEVDGNHQRHGPDPLNGKWNAISPLTRISNKTFENSSTEQLTNSPAKVDISRHVSAKSKRTNLSSVRRAHSGKDTPRNRAEEFANDQHCEIWGEEGHENECCHKEEIDHHDFAVTVLWGEITVCHGADDVSNGTTVVQAGLPLRGNLVSRGPGVGSILHAKRWVSEERADESGIVACNVYTRQIPSERELHLRATTSGAFEAYLP